MSNILIKITLAEIKKSLTVIKQNNLLKNIHIQQLINMTDSKTINPLNNLNDILSGTHYILSILKNRGFINVTKVFESNRDVTDNIIIKPILNDVLIIPLPLPTIKYKNGDIIIIYPQFNDKNKYIKGIVDRYRFKHLFINVFNINGDSWNNKSIYNIHKDYSYQYIIKLPLLIGNSIISNLNIFKIDLSYFIKTHYNFILDSKTNTYIVDINNLLYDQNVWTSDNVNILEHDLLTTKIIDLKNNIDNIYNFVISYEFL
jgi:hypothetical protein